MMLRFSDPVKLKTKKIVYEDTFAAQDSATLEQLKELSSRRNAIEISINESSTITEAIAREMSGGLTSKIDQNIQKLENYLPLLENLVHHVDLLNNNGQIVRWTAPLKIGWSSALSTSSLLRLRGSKFYQIDDLRFELGMTLFLYGAMIREKALEVLQIDLVKSATLFRTAAGIYRHLAHELQRLQTNFSMEIPPEATSYVSNIMSLICLAEAQAVTIRKAEERGSSEGLLAKLHYGIAELLAEAAGILSTGTRQSINISSSLAEFIYSCKALHELKSQRCLAESLRSASQVGVAIGILQEALINAKKKTPGTETWKVVFAKEIDNVANTLKKLRHENECVWHEKIPPRDDLPVPQGNKIVSIIPYEPKRWERGLAFKVECS